MTMRAVLADIAKVAWYRPSASAGTRKQEMPRPPSSEVRAITL